jgi:glycosyltransferase involved in cell wall biosynthesis
MNAYFLSFLKRSEYATMPTEQAISDLLPKNRKRFKVPVEAISNGIDLSRFAKGRANKEIYEKYGIPRNKPIVLYVGRVDPEKSLDVLMYAFIQAREKVPDAELVVVGDGTARETLEKIAAKNNIEEYVHFTGRVVGDDLPQLYRTGSMFGITSKTETQSIVLMEAMASGLPAVAVRAGAIPELIADGKNGYLIDYDNIDNYVNKLSLLMSNLDLRIKMGKDGYVSSKRYEVNQIMPLWRALFEQLIQK